LRAMLDQPGRSLTELAEHLCWYTMEGQPHKQKVHRVMKDLQKAKLVEQRRDGHYVLTKNKGEEEAAKTPEKITWRGGRCEPASIEIPIKTMWVGRALPSRRR
jgi:hypothetical protein